MEKQGHIEKKTIEQTYCEVDKMFLPDRFVKGTCPFCKTPGQYGDNCESCGRTYDPMMMEDSQCTICGNKPSSKKSEHLFFVLNHFKDFLATWVKAHTTKEISNKLLEWFDDDLRSWDISRDEPYFGFKIPGQNGKYFYVWVDAPVGYIASTWCYAKGHGKHYKDFWNDSFEIHHFIGKDIIYFHSLFWPAMLKVAKLSLPEKIHVHGFLTFNGEKLSKSRGNIIGAGTLLR